MNHDPIENTGLNSKRNFRSKQFVEQFNNLCQLHNHANNYLLSNQ